jgi:uncharacterized protein
MSKTFLKAEWRKLVMANYAIDQAILIPHLPYGTELDLWKNTCYVSLVGFMFLNTKMLGMKIPFHINFEEVNLRFYVRHFDGKNWKRGVVFIKEIVPKPMLSFVANTLYHENYSTMPMQHSWKEDAQYLNVQYQWKKNNYWNSLSLRAHNKVEDISSGSEEEFITEHYWGYTKINDKKTSEYEVAHPTWKVYPTIDFNIETNFGEVYGNEFDFLKNENPTSVFLAEGSEIKVKSGSMIHQI